MRDPKIVKKYAGPSYVRPTKTHCHISQNKQKPGANMIGFPVIVLGTLDNESGGVLWGGERASQEETDPPER